MRTETRTITIGADDAGQRLDVFLTARFEKFSRSEWQKRIDGGAMRLNGISARAARKIRPGDILEFSYTMRDEPEVDTTIAIIFEDDDYLVVNKPPGLPVHPSGIYKTRTVTTVLAETQVLAEPFLLHRLDRETSGVLALAKNRRAAAAFQKVMRAGGIEKDYQVAVEGNFPASRDAQGYIYRPPESRLPRQRFYKEDNPPAEAFEARACRTLFTLLKRHNSLSLLAARLFTGRMHQIRATLYSLGFPVVGDKLYGVDTSLYFRFADAEMTDADWHALRIARSALHCHRLRLLHPMRHNAWELEAPLSADIEQLFA
jgi:23S rRNA pseudouridine1911/1915/1917 synthase